MVRLDAHHHFWKFDPVEYGWIGEGMTALRRDFLPTDLREETSAAGVSGVISVQARQTVEETRWLLELADQNDFVKGVVGWVPLVDPNASALLEKFAGNKKLRGVRHVLQDEADENYMLREDFNRGVRELKRFGLRYDILIFERHLPQTIKFVDQHPDQVFIVDHLAKPRVRDNAISPWRENMYELAKRPNVYCKISGLATEADHVHWTEEQLRPYMDVVFEAFGPKRVMFGSDWPVCRLALPFPRWVAIMEESLSHLSTRDRERVWSGTAVEAYRL